MRQRAVILHRVMAVMIAVAVPAAASIVNGQLDVEFIVLGALTGFAYWYWGPTWPPL